MEYSAKYWPRWQFANLRRLTPRPDEANFGVETIGRLNGNLVFCQIAECKFVGDVELLVQIADTTGPVAMLGDELLCDELVFGSARPTKSHCYASIAINTDLRGWIVNETHRTSSISSRIRSTAGSSPQKIASPIR